MGIYQAREVDEFVIDRLVKSLDDMADLVADRMSMHAGIRPFGHKASSELYSVQGLMDRMKDIEDKKEKTKDIINRVARSYGLRELGAKSWFDKFSSTSDGNEQGGHNGGSNNNNRKERRDSNQQSDGRDSPQTPRGDAALDH